MFSLLIRPSGAVATNARTNQADRILEFGRRRLRLRWLIGADGRLESRWQSTLSDPS